MASLKNHMEKEILKNHKTGSILGIVIGGILSILGVILLAFGLAGSIEWIVKAGNISSKLINASPGIIIVTAGIFLVMWFKPKYRIEHEIKQTPEGYHEKITMKASSPIQDQPRRLPFE